jgi:hypothetical protein
MDLGFHNRWMLHPIDATVMTRVPKIHHQIDTIRNATVTANRNTIDDSHHGHDGACKPSPQPPIAVSVLTTNFDNEEFFRTSSTDRIAELASWRRETLFPKTHLLIDGVVAWGSFTSIWPIAFDQIHRQTTDVDAEVICDASGGKLSFASGQNRHPEGTDAQRWAGQTFCFEIHPPETASLRTVATPHQISLPILPMPGWEAHFYPLIAPISRTEIGKPTTSEAAKSTSIAKRERSLPTLANAEADGALHLRITVPERYRQTGCRVRCVYRPPCFALGLWLSAAGWLAVVAVATQNFFSGKSR